MRYKAAEYEHDSWTPNEHISFHRNWQRRNQHGKDFMPVLGPKWLFLKLHRETPGFSFRLIRYYSDGSWRFWDIDVNYNRSDARGRE